SLVLLCDSRLLHFFAEPLLHFFALAFEKATRGLHLFEVLLARDVGDTRRGAVFQVCVEAMTVITLVWGQRPAAAQVVLSPDQRQCAAQSARIRERTEIARTVILLESRQREARNGIIHVDLQQQEPFVVAK